MLTRHCRSHVWAAWATEDKPRIQIEAKIKTMVGRFILDYEVETQKPGILAQIYAGTDGCGTSVVLTGPAQALVRFFAAFVNLKLRI
jgi:hypothetical protein